MEPFPRLEAITLDMTGMTSVDVPSLCAYLEKQPRLRRISILKSNELPEYQVEALIEPFCDKIESIDLPIFSESSRLSYLLSRCSLLRQSGYDYLFRKVERPPRRFLDTIWPSVINSIPNLTTLVIDDDIALKIGHDINPHLGRIETFKIVMRRSQLELHDWMLQMASLRRYILSFIFRCSDLPAILNHLSTFLDTFPLLETIEVFGVKSFHLTRTDETPFARQIKAFLDAHRSHFSFELFRFCLAADPTSQLFAQELRRDRSLLWATFDLESN